MAKKTIRPANINELNMSEKALGFLKGKERAVDLPPSEQRIKYPDLFKVSPSLKPTSLDKDELFLLWLNEELPKDVNSIDDAIKSASGFGEHLRQLIAMGKDENILKETFKQKLKTALLRSLKGDRFFFDRFRGPEEQIEEKGLEKKVKTIIKKGASLEEVVDTLDQSLSEIPSFGNLPPSGLIVEDILASSSRGVVFEYKGKLFQLHADTWIYRELNRGMSELKGNEENLDDDEKSDFRKKKKFRVKLFPADWMGNFIGSIVWEQEDNGFDYPLDDPEDNLTDDEQRKLGEFM
jgi:hypothetical protein